MCSPVVHVERMHTGYDTASGRRCEYLPQKSHQSFPLTVSVTLVDVQNAYFVFWLSLTDDGTYLVWDRRTNRNTRALESFVLQKAQHCIENIDVKDVPGMQNRSLWYVNNDGTYNATYKFKIYNRGKEINDKFRFVYIHFILPLGACWFSLPASPSDKYTIDYEGN